MYKVAKLEKLVVLKISSFNHSLSGPQHRNTGLHVYVMDVHINVNVNDFTTNKQKPKKKRHFCGGHLSTTILMNIIHRCYGEDAGIRAIANSECFVVAFGITIPVVILIQN